jgi:ribonuclease D
VKGARDLSRRELALLRELVQWRDALARAVDKATFRVVGNDALLEAARLAPRNRDALAKVKGMPRGVVERNGKDALAAIERGLAVPEAQLPKFPKGKRWARDPDFDTKVSRLRTARDDAAKRLDLDPGVLCSRDRMEAIARLVPRAVDELSKVEDLRRWQADELGDAFVAALREFRPVAGAAANDDSPYRDEPAA